MFQPLSQQTVFEARAKAKRDTVVLLVLLFSLYGLVFALMGSLGTLALFIPMVRWEWVEKAAWGGLFVGAFLGLFHYLGIRGKKLNELLGLLRAQKADPRDEVHARLIRLVGEIEVAAGLRGIRPVVVPSIGLNAFSLADGEGGVAIGVTEGLLAKLDRVELAAVVAHEASHLVQGDTRLLTLAGVLSDSFDSIAKVMGYSAQGRGRTSGQSGGGGGFAVLVVWVVALIGKGVMWFLSMALSRSREYMADAQAARMTQNPLALAEALRKIAGKYRGAEESPDALKMVFILSPETSNLDEDEGWWADLFSTHPPVSRRIKRLLVWAKADRRRFMAEGDAKKSETVPEVPSNAPWAPRYYAFLEGAWCGPLTFAQWSAAGDVAPETWICPEGTGSVEKAGDSVEMARLFSEKVRATVMRDKCPRCHVPLVSRVYEGAPVEVCEFCQGTLLTSAVLDRLVVRREKNFTPEAVRKALAWRKSQREVSLKDAECGVQIRCPQCDRIMSKTFHRVTTRVVMDRCSHDGAIWLDGGELETIQILVENSDQMGSPGWFRPEKLVAREKAR